MSGAAIVKEANRYFGYCNWLEGTRERLDNSGFVVMVYKKVTGKSLPHDIGNLINIGTKVKANDLQLGDLVFTSSNHVGIYAGNGKFIHFANDGTIKVSAIYNFYTARRIL